MFPRVCPGCDKPILDGRNAFVEWLEDADGKRSGMRIYHEGTNNGEFSPCSRYSKEASRKYVAWDSDQNPYLNAEA